MADTDSNADIGNIWSKDPKSKKLHLNGNTHLSEMKESASISDDLQNTEDEANRHP